VPLRWHMQLHNFSESFLFYNVNLKLVFYCVYRILFGISIVKNLFFKDFCVV